MVESIVKEPHRTIRRPFTGTLRRAIRPSVGDGRWFDTHGRAFGRSGPWSKARQSAPGLYARSYFHRYTEDAVDLCDVFSSFSPQGKATLHEISRVMGLPGKPKGFDGGEMEHYFREGKIKEVADYCETDVINTYQCGCGTNCFAPR